MTLPLFPLHLVLFPGRPLPLHVFEPRYRQLLDDCLAGDRCFGVVAIRAGQEVGATAEVFQVGTMAEIEQVKRLPDGRSDIVTRGVARFRIEELLPPEPYLRAEVSVLPDPAPSSECTTQSSRLRALLGPYLQALGAPPELLEHLPTDPVELGYLAAGAVQTELPEQQRLLEIDDPAARVDLLLGALRREVCLMRHFGTVGSLRPPGPGGAELN